MSRIVWGGGAQAIWVWKNRFGDVYIRHLGRMGFYEESLLLFAVICAHWHFTESFCFIYRLPFGLLTSLRESASFGTRLNHLRYNSASEKSGPNSKATIMIYHDHLNQSKAVIKLMKQWSFLFHPVPSRQSPSRVRRDLGVPDVPWWLNKDYKSCPYRGMVIPYSIHQHTILHS